MEREPSTLRAAAGTPELAEPLRVADAALPPAPRLVILPYGHTDHVTRSLASGSSSSNTVDGPGGLSSAVGVAIATDPPAAPPPTPPDARMRGRGQPAAGMAPAEGERSSSSREQRRATTASTKRLSSARPEDKASKKAAKKAAKQASKPPPAEAAEAGASSSAAASTRKRRAAVPTEAVAKQVAAAAMAAEKAAAKAAKEEAKVAKEVGSVLDKLIGKLERAEIKEEKETEAAVRAVVDKLIGALERAEKKEEKERERAERKTEDAHRKAILAAAAAEQRELQAKQDAERAAEEKAQQEEQAAAEREARRTPLSAAGATATATATLELLRGAAHDVIGLDPDPDVVAPRTRLFAPLLSDDAPPRLATLAFAAHVRRIFHGAYGDASELPRAQLRIMRNYCRYRSCVCVESRAERAPPRAQRRYIQGRDVSRSSRCDARLHRECSASLAAHSMLASQSLTIYFIFKIHGHGATRAGRRVSTGRGSRRPSLFRWLRRTARTPAPAAERDEND
jgi:chemotaxis protein histidine kinase CheA